jgi:hypothetical protein
MTSSLKIEIKKFNGKSFELWKIKMKDHVGGQRSVNCCGSMNYTYKNVSRILEKVGSEGEEHNLVVSLRFSITQCVKGSYNQGIMG